MNHADYLPLIDVAGIVLFLAFLLACAEHDRKEKKR